MKITLDSSIFVEALIDNSVHRKLCLDLLIGVYSSRHIALYEPSIMLFEFVSAVDRATKNVNRDKSIRKQRIKAAIKMCERFINRPNSHFWSINSETWKNWTGRIVNDCIHKTQDELFVYTAFLSGSVLVTLDAGMYQNPSCAIGSCTTISPYECLMEVNKINNDLKK